MQGSLGSSDGVVEEASEHVKTSRWRSLHREQWAVSPNTTSSWRRLLTPRSSALTSDQIAEPASSPRVTALRSVTYEIIYRLVEDIEAAMLGMLAPTIEEVVTGRC